jgi:hypothetical protein
VTKLLYEIPFTIISLVIYNLAGAGLFGGAGSWDNAAFSFKLPSGGTLAMTWGGLLIIVSLFILFVEIIKSTRTTAPTIIDHAASLVVFVIFLVEFIVVGYCATPTFVVLMVIALIDVIGGFTITIRGSRRDYAIERDTV